MSHILVSSIASFATKTLIFKVCAALRRLRFGQLRSDNSDSTIEIRKIEIQTIQINNKPETSFQTMNASKATLDQGFSTIFNDF